MEIWENQLATELNNAGFELSIIAAFCGVGSIKYIMRLVKPNWDSVDFVVSLDGLKKLGELFLNLHSFAQQTLQVNDQGKLRDLLTAKNLSEYSNFKKTIKISP
jgi:hypothetical protein